MLARIALPFVIIVASVDGGREDVAALCLRLGCPGRKARPTERNAVGFESPACNAAVWIPSSGETRRFERVKRDRKSTRLNSSHVSISYAVFCLKKKKIT